MRREEPRPKEQSKCWGTRGLCPQPQAAFSEWGAGIFSKSQLGQVFSEAQRTQARAQMLVSGWYLTASFLQKVQA